MLLWVWDRQGITKSDANIPALCPEMYIDFCRFALVLVNNFTIRWGQGKQDFGNLKDFRSLVWWMGYNVCLQDRLLVAGYYKPVIGR